MGEKPSGFADVKSLTGTNSDVQCWPVPKALGRRGLPTLSRSTFLRSSGGSDSSYGFTKHNPELGRRKGIPIAGAATFAPTARALHAAHRPLAALSHRSTANCRRRAYQLQSHRSSPPCLMAVVRMAAQCDGWPPAYRRRTCCHTCSTFRSHTSTG
jgi:hypothetical protein